MTRFETVPHMNGRDWLILREGVTLCTVHKCGSNDPKLEAEKIVKALVWVTLGDHANEYLLERAEEECTCRLPSVSEHCPTHGADHG